MFTYNSKVVEDNIEEIWEQHTHKDYIDGVGWYKSANQFSLELAEKYSVTPVVSAGVLSALSPLKEWELNKRITDRFFLMVRTHPTDGWNRVPQLPLQRDKAYSIYKLGYNCHHPFIDEVAEILHGPKTVNFFYCIQNPLSCDSMVVDRHMISIALGQEIVSITSKQYLFLKEEYLNFAKRVNMIPNQAQAVLWVTYKRVKNI